MTANIYDIQNKAFSNVSAFAICKVVKNKVVKVATIQLRFPKDGAGRLWCYFHIVGLEMVRAYVGGYGYDKKSCVINAALEKCVKENSTNEKELSEFTDCEDLYAIYKLCEKLDSHGLDFCLYNSDYFLVQSV